MNATSFKPMPMKPRVGTLLTLCAALWLPQISARAAEKARPDASAKKPAAAVPASTNSVPEIPPSVFLVTSTTQEIRDPFFPKSARFGEATTTRSNAAPVIATVELTLKAIFGTPSRPFATINNVTFGIGEEHEVTTPSGKVRVQCVEIRQQDQVVVVEFAGRRRELRFLRR